jgi:uncharacterized protein (DUF305 family)
MPRKSWLCAVVTMCMTCPVLPGQQAVPEGAPAVVQPGAPGHANKILTPETTGLHLMPPTVADTQFMQGMIMHHGQAVEMTELVKTHSQDPKVLEIGRRISVSQTSEMAFMRLWLTDRGLPIEDDSMGGMAGMDMKAHPNMDMDDMAPMPGMLTPRQMAALRKANGREFDKLFLTGMIQHHGGALTMVRDLFNQPGAGQDATLFDFANDVDNTQTAEIDMMKKVLKTEKLL